MTLTMEPPKTEEESFINQESLRKRWPWYALGSVVAVALGIGAWWVVVASADAAAELEAAESATAEAETEILILSRAVESLEARNDESSEDVQALTEELQSLEAANSGLRDDLAGAEQRSLALAVENGGLTTSIAAARSPAEALAYMWADWDSTGLAEAIDEGMESSLLDDLLGELGHEVTIEEWAALGLEAGSGNRRNMALLAIEDPVLTDRWESWVEAEIDSDEEAWAGVAMLHRLNYLILRALGE